VEARIGIRDGIARITDVAEIQRSPVVQVADIDTQTLSEAKLDFR